MKDIDLTPTGQSYFDNQRAEYARIIENGKRLIKEVCPICNEKDFYIRLNGKRTCRSCNHQWNTKK